jgi:BirA family biotin operon repressor/biotin-[acetyl-CoA-carboxylase] ligase
VLLPDHTHLAAVGSTNAWALDHAAALPDGHWVLADRQTAGRGRRGRAWDDGSAGGNFMASLLVKGGGALHQLSFVAALALHDALTNMTAPHGAARLALKWPNDVLLDGGKVSGILLERAGDALVIGIGVNLAHHPDGTDRLPGSPLPTSLAAAGLPVPTPLALLGVLAPAFARWRAQWVIEGFAPVRAAWLARASGVGGRIVARLGSESPEGRFEGLADDGALLLRLDDGSLRPIHAGEVFAL